MSVAIACLLDAVCRGARVYIRPCVDCTQGRIERKKNFLEHDVETNDIDQAMAILLNVTSKQFQANVELYGAVHTDELR